MCLYSGSLFGSNKNIDTEEKRKMNKEQKRALTILKSGQNTFLTGAAGTGKTYVLNAFIESIREIKNIVICAPTGVAAINIGGSTIHRVFKIPIGPLGKKKKMKKNPVIDAADVIIIDEISMCRFDLFECVGQIIRAAEERTGIQKQLIVCGDFLQLPPVLTKNDREVLNEIWGESFVKNGFAFQAPKWEEFAFCNVELKEIIRQDNESEYAQKLNCIRTGDSSAVDWFNRNASKIEETEITLCGLNNIVNNINKQESDKLAGYKRSYEAALYGDVNTSDMVVEQLLELKIGMRVMTTINHPKNLFQNGSLGTVIDFDKDYVTVSFDNGNTVPVEKYEWEVSEYRVDGKKIVKEIIGGYNQIPLKIAFATTIHKSQGQTFNSATIHPSCFNAGQLYVALSRVTKIEGLHLAKAIKEKDVIVSNEVMDFCAEF